MISARYVPAVCLLLALALVPTVIHSYAGMVVDDGRTTSTIPAVLAGFGSTPSDRHPTWGERRFESQDWVERRYTSGADDVRLTVVRSYDLKALYHHPELAVSYGTTFTRNSVRMLGPDAGIPVHVLETDMETGPVVLYVLHYGDQFVSDPIRFQLQTAAELLFSGRRQMTLFFARGDRAKAGQAVDDLPWAAVLFAAIEQFVSPDGGAARGDGRVSTAAF